MKSTTPRYKLKEYVNLKNRKGVFVITSIIHKEGKAIVYQVKPDKQYFVTESDIIKKQLKE
jgi:hypothetical protein